MEKNEDVRILRTCLLLLFSVKFITLIQKQDFQEALEMDAIQGIDLAHQLHRLRMTKNISDAEVELMMRSLAENVQSYEQVVEVSSLDLFPKS